MIDTYKEKEVYPLSDLKYENTCLVTEDNTIIMRVPYTMDKSYRAHLKKLEQEARDM